MEESKSVDCKLYLEKIKNEDKEYGKNEIVEFLDDISLKDAEITECKSNFSDKRNVDMKPRKMIHFLVKSNNSNNDAAWFLFFINESKNSTTYELYNIQLYGKNRSGY